MVSKMFHTLHTLVTVTIAVCVKQIITVMITFRNDPVISRDCFLCLLLCGLFYYRLLFLLSLICDILQATEIKENK